MAVASDLVRTEIIAEHVLSITLDRSAVRNAINVELSQGLAAAVQLLEDSEDVYVGILAANGPVFCAGADLATLRDGRADDLVGPFGLGGLTRRSRNKILIAAVDGPALAGGLELVLACDMVIASSRASFGIPEVKRSLIANAGGVVRLPGKIPVNVAMEMAVTGDPIDAARAADLGLVNLVTEPGGALQGAVRLAERICRNAPIAVQRTRQLVNSIGRVAEEEAWRLSQAAFDAVLSTEDGQEGLAAFLEKREPEWRGR
jgi:enoyl-CoA hydratase